MSTNNFKFENVLAVVPDFKFDNRCMDEDCPHFEEEGEHYEHVENYEDVEDFESKSEIEEDLYYFNQD